MHIPGAFIVRAPLVHHVQARRYDANRAEHIASRAFHAGYGSPPHSLGESYESDININWSPIPDRR
ncbi:hypothetical protein EMIT0158MI4_100080 [Burkholderia ambifaria]